MNDNKSVISIIVPIYNAEKYLDRCLQSILKQTYVDIEVICVNDGSEDKSLEIIRDYSFRDKRIVIINKSNEGVSKARNDGIKKASGEYIMFVDADDWIEINTCEHALQAMKEHNTDIVMWSYISETNIRSTKKVIFPSQQVFEGKMLKEKIHRRFVGIIGSELAHPEMADSLSPVWGKLYKKRLIEGKKVEFIDLNKIGTYEDGLFNLQVVESAKKVIYIPEYLYHYRKSSGVSITTAYNKRLFKQWQTLFLMMKQYIENNKLGETYTEALNNRVAISLIGLGLNIVCTHENLGKKLSMIQQILNTDSYILAYKQLKIKYLPIHWKVFFFFAKHRMSASVYILLKIMQKMIG